MDQRDASRNFAGYTDREATRRKLVCDVLKRGDCWFRTGDLLQVRSPLIALDCFHFITWRLLVRRPAQADDDGFVYFVDRMGDTYRYKGENVSTTEIASDCV